MKVANTNARVLVVDDSPFELARLEDIGKRWLFDVHSALGGREALALASSVPFDAAIIDVWLDPPEDGFQLARALRALPGMASLPLGFVSGDTSFSNRLAAAEAGATLFLEKPLAEADFSAGIQRLLSSQPSHKPRVVVLEDDPEAAAALMGMLEQAGMLVTVLPAPGPLLEVLDGALPDLLLVSETLRPLGGLDVCRVVRTTPHLHDLPMILLMNPGNPKNLLAAYEAGADDTILRPIIPAELFAKTAQRISRARVQREQADRDPLSGLLLRRAFNEAAKARLAEAFRHSGELAVCLLDLDHLKGMNDKHGHLAGDRAVVTLGRLLQSRFREEDLRCRWGGDEFALLFPHQTAWAIETVVRRTMKEFQRMPLQLPGGELFHATFSAGIASYPHDGDTVDELLRAADRRLYVAKETRGTVVGTGPQPPRVPAFG
jgi:diguanylate cyclase (GGDEF)-like protein